jgi:flagellar protein FlaG
MDIQNVIGLGQASQPDLRGNVAARKVSSQAQVEPQVERKSAHTPQQLQQALETINRKLESSTALAFSVDQGTGQTVVRVTDKDTGEVIRQIPSDAALAIAESIGEFQKGLLLKQEA